MSAPHALRVETVTEKGATFIALSAAQALQLQALDFCRVSPASTHGFWRISDVTRVGVVTVDGLQVIVRPKTSLRSLIFMASYGGLQVDAADTSFNFDADRDLPTALARVFVGAVSIATRRGLLKGYLTVEEAGTVVRGRWDIARQLKRRPGLPLPLELTVDDYTEDIAENQILCAAARALIRAAQLPAELVDRLSDLLSVFVDVSDLGVTDRVTLPTPTRLNAHYQPALRIALWILEATSWAHKSGAHAGSTFLVNVAAVYERFVGEVLRDHLRPAGFDVELQVSDWRLDADGAIRLRPDIVISRGGKIVTVADTKYKVWGENTGSPPNADVYQALAYALTADISEAHLLYVSGDVKPRRYDITATGTTVIAHAVSLSGGPEDLLAGVMAVGWAIVGRGVQCSKEAATSACRRIDIKGAK